MRLTPTGFSYIFLCLTIIFFQPIDSLYSQSKQEFEKIFLKETQGRGVDRDYGNFKNVSSLSYYPDTLPSWFFSKPSATFGTIYAVGISDPDQTPEDAAKQAILRAKSFAALLKKAHIQYFRDVYSSEQTQGKQTTLRQRFDTYFKVSVVEAIDSNQFEIVNQYFTRYNEAVVLVRYSSGNESKEFTPNQIVSTKGTVLYIEAQVEDVFEPQAEYEYSFQIHDTSSPSSTGSFTYTEKENRFFSLSEFQGEKSSFPLYVYKYASPFWEANTQPMVAYYGLWSIYAKEFLRQLALTTEQTSVKIKTLGEQYSPQMSNLTREVAVKKSKIVINGIDFGEVGTTIDIEMIDID